jgi:histone H3/H4
MSDLMQFSDGPVYGPANVGAAALRRDRDRARKINALRAKGYQGPVRPTGRLGLGPRTAGRRTDGVAKATAGNLARDVLGVDSRVADKASKAVKDAVDKYIAAASEEIKRCADIARLKTATGHVRACALDKPILGFRAGPEVTAAHAGVTKLAGGKRAVAVATAHKELKDAGVRAGTEASELLQRAAKAYSAALVIKAKGYMEAAKRKTLFPEDVARALSGPLNC